MGDHELLLENLEYAVCVLETLPTEEKFQASRNQAGNYMDPIADMLVTIKNGYMAKKPNVVVSYSKFKLEIARVLEKENFIGKVENKDRKVAIELLYENQKPKISQVKKVSKLGLRVYTKSKKIPLVLGGKGLIIITTPEGVMTGKEAKAKKLGGEIICKVW